MQANVASPEVQSEEALWNPQSFGEESIAVKESKTIDGTPASTSKRIEFSSSAKTRIHYFSEFSQQALALHPPMGTDTAMQTIQKLGSRNENRINSQFCVRHFSCLWFSCQELPSKLSCAMSNIIDQHPQKFQHCRYIR
jgi:hypothetical protein